ncbi:MAG: MATE family efflux transporter [Clostridia bacterium]|nr:MATE family efflux transporter [Clostridia bacterium]
MFTKDKSFYKNFFSLYWVIVLQNVIVLGVGLADNIMIGAYSETSLAGVAAVNQIQFIYQQLIMSVGDALVVLGSQYWGQRRTEPIKRLLSTALFTGLGIGVILFTVASLTPTGVVGLFTESEAIVSEGASYLSLIRFTYIPFALTQILLASLRAVERVKIAFVTSVGSFVTNCAINYVLIFGRFGAPEMGVRGAAVGTLCARGLELSLVIGYLILRDDRLKLRLRDVFSPSGELTRDFFRSGAMIILAGGMFGCSTALQSVILGHMNDYAIAANSASTALYQVLKVAAVGASSATGIIIGKTLGMGRTDKIKEYTRTLQMIFLCVGVFMSVSLFFLRTPVLSLYDLSPETHRLANNFILILCVTGFGTAYEMPVLTGIVRGGGDSSFVFWNDLVSIWMIVLPLSYCAAFVFGWPPEAVVFCLNADQLFKCAAAAIKANRYRWMKKLTRES